MKFLEKIKLKKLMKMKNKFLFALGWKLELGLTADGFAGIFGMISVF